MNTIITKIPRRAARFIRDNLRQALDLYDQGVLALTPDEVMDLRKAHKAFWVQLDQTRKNKKPVSES